MTQSLKSREQLNRDVIRSWVEYSCQVSCPPNLWVQVTCPPNKFSYDEALLLCRHSEDEWVAWIPDHGETILKREEFAF